MDRNPRMLVVETGWRRDQRSYFSTDVILDYRVYESVPRLWRWFEQRLRLDLYLALRARKMAGEFDIIWANSERVAIPLSLLRSKVPLVAVLHYPESPLRAILLQLTGMAKKWAGIGIVSPGSRAFLERRLGVDPSKMFQYYSARLDVFRPATRQMTDGPIMSIGVAKRDYRTLIDALSTLSGYRTEILVSSKYGDVYKGRRGASPADWIEFPGQVSEPDLVSRYQRSRFVVVPLRRCSHSGAGVTSVFEAGACGRAVIATRTGGMEAFVKDGQTGILVPPYDVVALRRAIQRLWNDSALADQMGLAARKFLEENFNNAVVNRAIISYLRRICPTCS